MVKNAAALQLRYDRRLFMKLDSHWQGKFWVGILSKMLRNHSIHSTGTMVQMIPAFSCSEIVRILREFFFALEKGDHASFKAVLIAMDSDEEQFLAAFRSAICCRMLPLQMSSPLYALFPAVKPPALCSFATRYSVLSLKRPGRCLSKPLVQSLISPCASSNWSLSWPKGSPTRKLLLA